MKHKIAQFVILVSLVTNAKGQFAVGGVPGSVYVDIVPDDTVSSGNHLLLDMDQDGTADIKIQSTLQISPGVYHMSVYAGGMRPEVQVSYDNIDSTYMAGCSYWQATPVLTRYNNGDSIHSSTFASRLIAYVSYSRTTCGMTASSNEWISAGEKYIGVSILTSGVTNYGWIKVKSIDALTCIVDAHSFFTPMSTSLSSAPSMVNDLYITPNPASGLLYLRCSIQAVEAPQLFDLCGRNINIKSTAIEPNKYMFDVSDLNSGIYYFTIGTLLGTQTKKFIIQR